jgi:aerobic C4-dicarboxylate transport protein
MSSPQPPEEATATTAAAAAANKKKTNKSHWLYITVIIAIIAGCHPRARVADGR